MAMFSRAMLVVLAVGLVGSVFTGALLADGAKDAKRITITGMGKALGDASGKLDPSVANATLTVTKNGAQVVYYVYGWAGVIVAKQADGKMAEVSGVVAKKHGKRTITGKSIDVKIIVVEDKSAKKSGS